MSSSSSALDIEALLSGQVSLPSAWLEGILPGAPMRADAALGSLFWAKWQRQSALHEHFLAALEPLASSIAQLSAADWVGAVEHPLWHLLELLQNHGAGYQPELGRAADKLLSDLTPIWSALDSEGWSAAAAVAHAQWQQEQHRLQRLEQRLIDSERGLLRSRRAQQQAARVLNRALAGKRLPAAILAYMQDDWFRELQWSLLQFGENSGEWERRIDLTERLIDSMQDPGGDTEQRQRLYALIPEIDAELRAVLSAHAAESSVLERQLALIEAHHLDILKGRPQPAVSCTLIANDDPWSDASTTLSRDLLRQVETLQLGSWFLLRDSDGEKRIKLVLKMDDTAQLLFVNRVGVKALQKTFDEFAYALATDTVIPLPVSDHGRAALRQLLLQLQQRGIKQERARADEARREQEQTRREQEEQLRLAAEEQRRRAAREKAIAEAVALAAAQEQAAQQARLEVEQHAREQERSRRLAAQQEQAHDIDRRLRSARQSATLLAVGSWVEFHDDMGAVQRLKLAVKLPSSGKLIFVDREGVRCAEFERDAFAQRLLESSARVLDAGPQFEDTLARVVGSLRRDRPKE